MQSKHTPENAIDLVLASASPRRRELLAQIGLGNRTASLVARALIDGAEEGNRDPAIRR